MPALRNARHESFAQALARGASAIEAYAEAGYSVRGRPAAILRASDLLRDAAIARRAAELRDGAIAPAGADAASEAGTPVTVDTLIAEAEHVRRLALEAGRFADAIAAIKEKGVLAGVRVDKRDGATPIDPKTLSDDELALIARGGGGGAVAPPPGQEVPD
ncbi:hypothetical protein [Chelatococcus reniformis]|nr:hypothetical protein [Chelatococcus reniformis]